jgi:hypothetical protein
MIWKPHMTVAALVERDGRFLLVQERIEGASVLETREETGWRFEPDAITGIYRWREPVGQQTYIRVGFRGRLLAHDPDMPLDEGIEQILWLTADELEQQQQRLRSPLVLRCIRDYLGGARYPLELLNDLE